MIKEKKMSATDKPRVIAMPVADRHSSLSEKIIEFGSPVGGGLISFTVTADDQLAVHVYRHDLTVNVTAGEHGQPVRTGNLRQDAATYEAARAYVAAYEARQEVGS